MAEIRNVTAETFEAEVLKSSVPVLVDFYAPWCGPCRAMMPTLAELSEEADGKFSVAKANTDEESRLAAEFGVSAVPTILIFAAGKVTAKLVGLQNKTRLLEALGAE